MISVFFGIVLGVLLSALASLVGWRFGDWIWRRIISRVLRSSFGGAI